MFMFLLLLISTHEMRRLVLVAYVRKQVYVICHQHQPIVLKRENQ